MKCINCEKGNMEKLTTTYYKKKDDRYYIVENVPCYICDYCGEVTYSIKTLAKIDSIIEKIANKEKANIVVYDEAA